MRTVLITGAAGYIASSVIDILLKDGGYKVVGFDNNFKNSCDTLLPFITDPNFEFVMGDITEYDAIKNVCDKYEPDYILHAAALVGYPICEKYKELAYLVNVVGTAAVIDAKATDTKLIFCSTGSLYKPGQAVCDETAVIEPPSHYGRTKEQGELIVLEDENSIVLRFGTAMGVSKNNIRVNLLTNDLTYQSYLNRTITIFESTFLRSFIHVRDIASAIVFTFQNFNQMRYIDYSEKKMKKPCPTREEPIFNVSNNDINITKGELCEFIRAKLGTHVCYAEVGQDRDKRDYRMVCDKIYAHRWRPKVSLDDTLDELIKVAPLLSVYDKYK